MMRLFARWELDCDAATTRELFSRESWGSPDVRECAPCRFRGSTWTGLSGGDPV